MQNQTTETKSLPTWQRPVITRIDISQVTMAFTDQPKPR